MTAVIAAAWRVILRRAQANWAILGAAVLTILLATTLLSAGPIYAGAVTLSGLRRTLHDSPIDQANVQVSIFSATGEYNSVNKIVSDIAPGTFAATGGSIERSGKSESFALPGQPADNVTDLMIFSFFQNIEQHATLVSGNWPATTDGNPVQVAIPQATAELLNLKIGSTMNVQSRRVETFNLNVVIAGIYKVNNPSEGFWWNDPLAINGSQQGASFTTYGPFVTTTDTFFKIQGGLAAQVYWRIFPNFDNLTVSEVSGLIANIEGLKGTLNRGRQPNDSFEVNTTLNTILRTAQKSLLVTRSGVLIVTVQLAILAGYALLLTSNLLVDQRRVETGLLHSRGASTGQIVTMALMEALMLATPAAILGPWIAKWSLHIFNHIGPLASIGLPVNPVITRDAYALSVASAIGCVLALALPMLVSARTFVQARAARGRQAARGLAQSAGIDLMLVAIAILGYWQLSRYRGAITESVQGRLGIDPFLVAAPAIGLVAGAIIALRLVPLLARIIDRAATRQRGLVASLGAWQVSRRPLRYARSALLLMIAMAIGLFALSYGSTWDLSQHDQADYQIGADVRLQPDIRIGSSIPQYDLAQAQKQIDGVEATMPANRDLIEVSRSAGSGQLLAIDAAEAPGIIPFRADLSDQSFSSMMAVLKAKRPVTPAVQIPGTPQSLVFTLSMKLDPLTPDAQTTLRVKDIFPSLSLVIQDANGVLYRLTGGNFNDDCIPQKIAEPASRREDAGTLDCTPQQLVVPLSYTMENGETAMPSYPLKLVSFEMTIVPLAGIPRSGIFELQNLQGSSRLDGQDPMPISLDWKSFGWSTEQVGLSVAPSIELLDTPIPNGFAAKFNSGASRGRGLTPFTFSLMPNGPRPDPTMSAIVNTTFLKETESKVGDTLSLDIGGMRRSVNVIGAVKAFPTLNPDQAGIIVDFPTLVMEQFETGGRVLDDEEWWLATSPGMSEKVASVLSNSPYSSPRVDTRAARMATLRTDPVALGIIGALSLGFVAAALFAAIGFAVSSAVSARERLTEFALLRALGLSTRQLTSWLSLENGLLIAFSLIAGTALGLVLAYFILPLVSLTQAATQTIPEINVVVPWRSVLILEGTSLAALVIVVVVLATLLRRIGLGSSLRLGEE